MEGIVEIETPGAPAFLFGIFEERIEHRARSRNRHAAAGIDRGDFQLRKCAMIEKGLHVACGYQDRGHRAAVTGDFLARAARQDDPNGGIDVESARAPGCGHLPHTVSDRSRRFEAAFAQRLDDRDLDGKQKRLGAARTPDLDRQFRRMQGLDDRPSGDRTKALIETGQSLPKRLIGVVGGESHARPLRAIAGEYESNIKAGAKRGPLPYARSAIRELLAERGRDDHPLRQEIAGVRGSIGDRRSIALLQTIRIAIGKGRQRCGAVRGQDQRRLGGGPGRGDRGGFAQHDMGVGAAEPERIDTGVARSAAARNFQRVSCDAQIQIVEGNVRIGFVEMQRGWKDLTVERHDGLDDAGETGCRLQVADIGLDRADRQRRGAALSEHAAKRFSLGRIADPGAGSVCLNEGEIVGRDPGAGINVLQKRGLRIGGGQRQPDRAPVLIGPRPDHKRMHAVAIAACRLFRSQHERDRTLASDIAIAPGIECPAQAGWRQHRRARKT